MINIDISQNIQDYLVKKNIQTLTAVQEKIIPEIRKNKNILFQSETGTGKTLAYLIPILEQMDENSIYVQTIIIAPTHELASQIKSEIQSVSKLKTALLIGGVSIKRQIELLKDKPSIVIGGPVRLLELINLKKLKIEHVKNIVLDEVDRLLSPELRDPVVDLVSIIPAQAFLTACSATVKPKIASILEDALLKRHNTNTETPINNKIEMILLPPEDIITKKISHWAIFSEQRDKISTLCSVINALKPEKMLIFTARPDQVMNILTKLQYKKIDCICLHAREDKQERKQAIDKFRSGKSRILVTSDLSSRGLDFPGISHIVQMDVPSDDDFFIHRAGRTARAGLNGINIVIGDAREMRILSKIEKHLGIVIYPKQCSCGKIITPWIDPDSM